MPDQSPDRRHSQPDPVWAENEAAVYAEFRRMIANIAETCRIERYQLLLAQRLLREMEEKQGEGRDV